MKISKFISLIFFILNLFFLISPLKSKELKFENLNKLNLNDLQILTKTNLFKNKYSTNEINQIISDLYQSELIYNIDYNYDQNFHIFVIDESKIIDQIFFNGNIQLKYEDLINSIKSSEKSLFEKNKSLEDLKIISSLYINQGYEDVNVSLSTETVSENRINLIFKIYEGQNSNIVDINFLGNKFFSNRYLANIIKSEPKSFLSFFSGGSNFDKNLFQFDRDLLINLYKDNGYLDIKINYQLNRLMNKNYVLNFYIIENERVIISKVDLPNEELLKLPEILEIFSELSDYSKNDKLYYDKEFISSFIDESNKNLKKNNINDFYFDYSLDLIDQTYVLKIHKIEKKQLIVNRINIYGNSITKDETIRSKINLQPGDILNQDELGSIKSKLTSYRYINDVNISSENFEKFTDISIDLEENKKTGSFLFGGSISGDTGLGAVFSIKDYNFLGSGNEINTSIDYNSENTLFRIKFTQYPFSSNSITNNYVIYSQENDYSSSYGYKVQDQGIGYSLGFDYSKNVNINLGFEYSNLRGHSASNQNNYITDNIGNFQNFFIRFGINHDTTNDILYPTNGMRNTFAIELSPNEISDDKFIKSSISNSIYYERENEDFLFISNKFGLADSFSGSLKTRNTYSLGGLNFRGFDYRGIGPFSDNIYLGGNKYFTSTIGYGGTFLFDKKDNVIFKLFATTGSIWDSDYSNNDFKLRSSMGLSIDFMSVIPISISYAVPIQKDLSDKSRNFNFTIGTSF